MTAQSINLDVVGWTDTHGFARAEVVHYGLARRLLRALKGVALVWMVAVPLMFIPWLVVLAFPTAVVLSAYVALQHLRAPNVARLCKGTCPDCGHVQVFDVPERFELPLEIECSKCSRELWLEEHAGAA